MNNNTPALLNLATGKAGDNLQILDNRVIRLNTDTATGPVLVNGDTSSTGMIARNLVQTADTAGELIVPSASGITVFENYVSGVVGASGYINPARDS